MLISIKERTKEIGIRRAVGAKRRDILFQFFSEALILSIGGGIIGVIIGITVSMVVALFAGWPFIISINAIVAALLSTFIIGIFSGVYPARKAALLDPIKALQFE